MCVCVCGVCVCVCVVCVCVCVCVWHMHFTHVTVVIKLGHDEIGMEVACLAAYTRVGPFLQCTVV